MNIKQFNETYKSFKDADLITISCDCQSCVDPIKNLKKVSAKRNIAKNSGEKFICRECYMRDNNPLFNPPKEKRQTDEIINVICPDCHNQRTMKKSGYFGSMEMPYKQVCGSCVQKGKIISEEQKAKISETLTGRELSQEHCDNISKYWKEHPECISRDNLIPGYSSGWNKGMIMPPEVGEKISLANTGVKKTEEHKQHISEGRKKMLEAQGGLLPETKAKLSLATIEQYKDGFDPKLHHRKGKHTTKTGEVIPYRSSYEKKAFMLLDADPNVESYKYEPFPIVYRKPGAKHDSNYLIDLLVTYVDGTKKLIEVKPQKRIDRGVIEKVKLEAADQFSQSIGFLYETWTEKELFNNSEKEIRKFIDSIS